MKAVKKRQPEKCKETDAKSPPLFGHLKPLPQSLSPEEATLQFLRNNRVSNFRSAP